jgi:hypothetical protein
VLGSVTVTLPHTPEGAPRRLGWLSLQRARTASSAAVSADAPLLAAALHPQPLAVAPSPELGVAVGEMFVDVLSEVPSMAAGSSYTPRTLQEMLLLEGAEGTLRQLRQHYIEDDLYGGHNRVLEAPPCPVHAQPTPPASVLPGACHSPAPPCQRTDGDHVRAQRRDGAILLCAQARPRQLTAQGVRHMHACLSVCVCGCRGAPALVMHYFG